LEALFSPAQQINAVTVPLQIEGGAYYVFHYNNSVEPVPLTLEEATPAIREALTARKSDRAVNDAASAALAKLNEVLQSGSSFAEAAKTLGLKTETLPDFSENEPPAERD